MDLGNVKSIDINDEMRDSYLSYAMSVIVSRALPDARDGLKPVQRRILYAMNDMGLRPKTPHRKSARVVGEVLGKYHPHGDQSVYDAMVRMAQDFSMRIEHVDGQGNFGSIDGDGAAAMRYTEARLTEYGQDMLNDINSETVDFATNFDESLEEPVVLPASIPNLLVNGASGIAVGMSTSIPPHNIGEVVDALTFMIDKWKKYDNITVADLTKFIKGPDFPTGGLIFRYRGEEEDAKDMITSAYATGRGRIIVRAKAHVEKMERKKSRIVITELPYQTNKTNLITRIADLHRDGRIEGLTDMRDESDRNGMRIVLETTRNVEPSDVLENLFRLTPLQSTFSVIMLALVNNEPRILTLKQALKVYLDHRLVIVQRRSEYELRKMEARAHILEGLMIALDNLDKVIALIRKSRNTETARENLIKTFKLSDIQARAILDMQLRRLAALERKKIQDEYKEVMARIKFLERLLSKPELMRGVIKEELLEMREAYVDGRRTQIIDRNSKEVTTTDDLVPDQNVWVMVGQEGTLARTTNNEMPTIPVKPKEPPAMLLEANARDTIYLITADGKTVGLPVYQLPQSREYGDGTHYADLTAFSRRQHLAAAIIAPDNADGFVFMTTVAGAVKRVKLEDLPGMNSDPTTIIRVDKNDSLMWARVTNGEEEVLMASAFGQLIRFKETEVRSMGLGAGGVSGIKLKGEEDGIVACDLASSGNHVWSVTDTGLAKATPIDEYPTKSRNGQGVVNIKMPPKEANEVVSMVVADEDAEVIVITSLGGARKVKISKGVVGRRSLKPKAVVRVGERTRVIAALVGSKRADVAVAEEDAAEPKQMALIDDKVAKGKKKAAKKK